MDKNLEFRIWNLESRIQNLDAIVTKTSYLTIPTYLGDDAKRSSPSDEIMNKPRMGCCTSVPSYFVGMIEVISGYPVDVNRSYIKTM